MQLNFYLVIYFLILPLLPFAHSRSSPLTLLLLPGDLCFSPIWLAIEMATPMVEDTSSFEEDQLASMSTEDIIRAARLLENEIRILKVPTP